MTEMAFGCVEHFSVFVAFVPGERGAGPDYGDESTHAISCTCQTGLKCRGELEQRYLKFHDCVKRSLSARDLAEPGLAAALDSLRVDAETYLTLRKNGHSRCC